MKGLKMKNFDIKQIDGIAFVLPKYESVGKFFRIRKLVVFANSSFDRFGIGIMILEAGILFQIGPVFFGACHIKKQFSAFERLNELMNGAE